VGAATPASTGAAETSLLKVTVTPGAHPASSGLTVQADLSLIGGSATQTFYDDASHGDEAVGDNVFSYNATVAAGTAAGSKSLPFTVGDAQIRTSGGTIALTVLAPTNPSAAGSATPSLVAAGETSLLTVTVTPGAHPASSGIAVTADLSAIGGAANQAFLDDGVAPDVSAGDNIFSYNATIAAGTAAGSKSLPVSVSDAQSRTAATTIALTVGNPASVTISQVYGGGGNSGAPYTNDYIELYNRTASPINLTGWSVQYASATGTAWNNLTILAGTIQPHTYFLIQEAAGATPSNPLPTPDQIGSIALGSTNGKVALVNNSTELSGTCPTSSSIVDFVGFGTANCYEGTAAVAALSNTTAALRKGNGDTDTNQNQADFTVGAPNPRNSLYGVEQAPSVLGVVPANNATEVAVAATLKVNFSEPVDVAAGWFSIACTTSGAHTAVVTGGPTNFTLTPDVAFSGAEQCTVVIDHTKVTDQDTDDAAYNAMLADYTWKFLTVGASVCAFAPANTIAQVQGSTDTSPFVGQTVTVEGIVVADFQATGGQSGFYLQDPTGDGNPVTSEGVFVYSTATDVSVGQRVRVTAPVSEYMGLTELSTSTAANVVVCGADTPIAPTLVTLPETTDGELERYEGMLITISQTLTVDQNYFLGRYGQLTLSANGRLYNPTNGNDAGTAAEIAAGNAKRIIFLDDASAAQNPNPIPYVYGIDPTVRPGDVITTVTGALDFGPINSNTSLRDYRIQPLAAPTFVTGNPRPAAPAALAGNLKVATFNVLNYFNGPTFPTSRGATTAAEFARQRAKIINAIATMDADVVGLMEIENDGIGADSAIQDLVNGLNAKLGAGTYDFVKKDSIGTDEIRVALIYQPASVSLVGAAQEFQVSAGGYTNLFDRPPLAQTFSVNAAPSQHFVMIVNHFKSKGCPGSGADADQGDLQGCYNAKRTVQAQEMVKIVNTIKASEPNVLVVGDLNAYSQEDPIKTLEAGGLVNVTTARIPAAERYSYVFDGQSGELDHIMATASLNALAPAATIWHINADEPSVIDYNTEFKNPDLYTDSAYRASDHDPVILGLNLTLTPVAPTVEILTHPVSVTLLTEASFTFAGSYAGSPNGLTYECALDGAAYATCVSPKPYTGLAVGEHTFAVRAVQSPTNKSEPATFTWKIEAAPVIPATPAITAPTNNSVIPFSLDGFNKPTFSGTAAAGLTVEVWLVTPDTAKAAPAAYTLLCSAVASAQGDWSCQSQTALAAGPHSVVVTAKDAVGNRSEYSAPVNFTILFTRYLSVISK